MSTFPRQPEKVWLNPAIMLTEDSRKSQSILLILLLAIGSMSGCLSDLVGEELPKPLADLEAWPTEIQQGDLVTFDARSSTTMEGMITSYEWDFGDGSTSETIVGLTSHKYTKWGTFEAEVTVVNDKGGMDTVSVTVEVNGAPQLELIIPEQVKAGDIAVLDASTSFDPEGERPSFAWDLDWSEDSDGDGDPRNDVDSTAVRVELQTTRSGELTGSLALSDTKGGEASTSWNLDVLTRIFLVEWTERTFEYQWEDYLEEGASWSESQFPGEEGLLLSVNAILELDRDLIEPQDNFTLMVEVSEAMWSESAQTSSSGNITDNQSAKAELQKEDLNPSRNSSEISSDTEEQLILRLLNSSSLQFGQDEWIWSITADQADPDAFIENLPDPDTGNQWTLTITYIILVPTITEIAQ